MKIYIVDGHNLVPKIPGFSLSELDDENKLMELLQEYCRITRTRMELFFDGAPPASAHLVKGGLVHTHFIRRGKSADDAIIAYLQTKQPNSGELVLVTSDHRIQVEARSLGIEVQNSESFSRQVQAALSTSRVSHQKQDSSLTPQEIETWLDLFSKNKPKP